MTNRDVTIKLKYQKIQSLKRKKQILKRKLLEKEKIYTQDYNDLILNNLLKEFLSTTSPHLLISRIWFYKIKKILLCYENQRNV